MAEKKKGVLIDDRQDHKVRYGRGKKLPPPPKPVDYSDMEEPAQKPRKKRHDDEPWPPRQH